MTGPLNDDDLELLFCLAVETEDRTLEEQAALGKLAEYLDTIDPHGHADYAADSWRSPRVVDL